MCLVSFTCGWVTVQMGPVSSGGAVGWGEPPNHLKLTHSGQMGILCLGQVSPKEAEELSWTSSHKSWIDATDK